MDAPRDRRRRATLSNDRIRVARIITRLNVGGPAIQALLLAKGLDPTRYESILIAGVPGPREGDMRELRGGADAAPVIVPTLGREISLLGDVRALVRIFVLLRRFRPHIVHTHLAKAGLLGRMAARAAGVPIVVHTFHGNVLRGYFDPVRSRLFLLLEHALARASTRIVAISPRQLAEIERLGIARPPRVVEVPLGLELGPFLHPPRGRLRAELGIPAEVPIIGSVARLVPIKGIDVFLRAAARVREQRPECRFVVVGDGELRDPLEALARHLGIRAAVDFLGWRSDLPAIYADCDVVTLTSHNEGTPVSVIEALATGRAVVATDVGGVPDVIGEDRGVLVRPGDPGAVAVAVLDLLRDTGRRSELGRRGRAHVHPEFNASTLVRRIDSLYRELVAGAPAG